MSGAGKPNNYAQPQRHRGSGQTATARSMSMSHHDHERPRALQPQQQPPVAVIATQESTPRMPRRRSCGSGSGCSGDVESTQKQSSRRDFKSPEQAAVFEYYDCVQHFQRLRASNPKSPPGIVGERNSSEMCALIA
eukprot:scaffold2937_cov137-Skeletonema_menzelii.AAC.6